MPDPYRFSIPHQEIVIRVIVETPGVRPKIGIDRQRIRESDVGRVPAHNPLRLIGTDAAQSLKPHLDTWRTSMESRGKKPASIARFRRLVERLIDYHSWRDPSQLTLIGAEAFIAAARNGEVSENGKPWLGTTCDQACSAFRRFGKHLAKHGIVDINPFQLLEGCGEVNGAGDRPATVQEAADLLRHSLTRCAGGDRRVRVNAAMYWYMLIYTGLRAWEEQRVLLWQDVYELDSETPHIWTHPTRCKNKRRMRIPIQARLAAMLRSQRASVPHGPDDPVFPKAPNRATFNVDRGNAMIVPKNGDGVFGAHSLRKLLSQMLDSSGCSAGIRYKIMRHAGNITEDRYTRTDLASEIAAINALPDLWPETVPVSELSTRKKILTDQVATGRDPKYSGTASYESPSMTSPKHHDAIRPLRGTCPTVAGALLGHAEGGADPRRGTLSSSDSARSAETAGVQHTRGFQAGNGHSGSVLGSVSNPARTGGVQGVHDGASVRDPRQGRGGVAGCQPENPEPAAFVRSLPGAEVLEEVRGPEQAAKAGVGPQGPGTVDDAERDPSASAPREVSRSDGRPLGADERSEVWADHPAALRDLRQPQDPRAPRGLQQAAGYPVAVPGASWGGSPEAEPARSSADSALAHTPAASSMTEGTRHAPSSVGGGATLQEKHDGESDSAFGLGQQSSSDSRAAAGARPPDDHEQRLLGGGVARGTGSRASGRSRCGSLARAEPVRSGLGVPASPRTRPRPAQEQPCRGRPETLGHPRPRGGLDRRRRCRRASARAADRGCLHRGDAMNRTCRECGSPAELVPAHEFGADADGNRGIDIPARIECTNDDCQHTEPVEDMAHA